MWGIVVDFVGGAPMYGSLAALLLGTQLGVGLKLHRWEEKEFNHWRRHRNSYSPARSATVVPLKAGRGESKISRTLSQRAELAACEEAKSNEEEFRKPRPRPRVAAGFCQTPTWFVVVAGIVLSSAAVAILWAFLIIFITPMATKDALSVALVFPTSTSYSSTAMRTSAVDGMVFGVLAHAIHMGSLFFVSHNGDLPPRIGRVILFFDVFFCGCVWGFMTFGGRPHGMETMAYGQGAIMLVNMHFRAEIRAVRMWGVPTDIRDSGLVVAKDFRLDRTLVLALIPPALYYFVTYCLNPTVAALLAGGFSFPEDPRLGTNAMRALPIMLSFRSPNSSVWSEYREGLKAALSDAPGALRVWYSDVLTLPNICIIMIGPAFSCLATAWLLIQDANKSHPTDHALLVQPFVQVMYWTGIFVVLGEQLLTGLCIDSPLLSSFLTLAVGLPYQSFIAAIIGGISEHMTDITTFEPELIQLPLGVTRSWLLAVCVIPLELGSPDFWLFMAVSKGLSVVLGSVPWAEMRSVKRNQERRAELFYQNFPFESVRARCISNQLTELCVAVFIAAPAAPMYYLLGTEPDKGGWIFCPSVTSSTDVGMLIMKLWSLSSL
jgi:hypothetical protein